MKKWLQLVAAPNVSVSFSSSLYLTISLASLAVAFRRDHIIFGSVPVLGLSVLLAAKAVIKFERAVVV